MSGCYTDSALYQMTENKDRTAHVFLFEITRRDRKLREFAARHTYRQFGNFGLFVADLYSTTLSKSDRGLDTDFDDLVFLIQNNQVDMDEFERIFSAALPHACNFDFKPDILEHFQELKNRLK